MTNNKKAIFVYKTKEWSYIGRSLQRYFKYCHKVDIYCHKIDNATDLPTKKDFKYNLLLTPLFENIEAEGLKRVKFLRLNDNYDFYPVFIVTNSQEIPHYFEPDKDMFSHAKEIIKDPDFGDMRKAVFLAELRYRLDKNREFPRYINIINLSDENALKSLCKIINSQLQTNGNLLEQYYKTFVKYYRSFPCKNDDDQIVITKEDFSEEPKGSEEAKDSETLSFLEKANERYNEYNGFTTPTTNTDGHRTPLQLFRSPLSFPLQELIDAQQYIEDALKKNSASKDTRKIKLLLIDNKTNKFKKEDKDTIFDLLKKFGINHLFDIQMLSGVSAEDTDNGFNPDLEKFDFKKFREKNTLEDEKKYHNIPKHVNTYQDLVYHRIKSSHFILLDFFLNDEDTYLAFDFIKDISKLKKEKGDHSTTWYFITSAVYDAVTKYSQSGLLAEYYELAVVNSGDDPSNKKRQIIFIYKLLTFIQARLKSFDHYKNEIEDNILRASCCNAENEPKCAHKNASCLHNMRTYIKKYLTEYDSMYSICYSFDEEAAKDYKNIIELLDLLIQYFHWLPEADWRILQYQVEAINSMLKSVGSNKRFNCSYILKEINRRSKIY